MAPLSEFHRSTVTEYGDAVSVASHGWEAVPDRASCAAAGCKTETAAKTAVKPMIERPHAPLF